MPSGPFPSLCCQIIDPLARGRAFRVAEDCDGCSMPPTPATPGAASLCSFTSSRSGFGRWPRRRKRESVAKMSFRAAAALVKVRGWEGRRGRMVSVSYLNCGGLAHLGCLAMACVPSLAHLSVPGPFCERWHPAQDATAQLHSGQLPGGRLHRGVPR